MYHFIQNAKRADGKTVYLWQVGDQGYHYEVQIGMDGEKKILNMSFDEAVEIFESIADERM